MRAKAVLMALAMMTTALAGCTGTDGVTEVDEDALNELIQDNLQDFINNTTVVVNQDFHYHNNTTVVNNYDETNNDFSNTTNVEGSFGGVSGFNGSGGYGLYLLDIQFNLSYLMDLEENHHRHHSLSGTLWLHDFDSDIDYEEYVTIDCGVYYIVGSDDFNSWNENSSLWEESYWVNSDWYGTGWAVYESLGYEGYNMTMRDLYHRIAWEEDVREICDEDYGTDEDFDDLLLFDIPIPEGVSLSGVYTSFGEEPGIHDYVWSPGGHHHDCSASNIHDDDWSWRDNYYPRCPDSDWSYGAFGYGFEFETINWDYQNGGWVGGDSDSILSVLVSDIYPGWEYRLIAYFHMSPVLPLE